MGKENKTEDKLLFLLSKKNLNKYEEKKLSLFLRRKLDWNYIHQNFTEKTSKRLIDFTQEKRIKNSLEIIDFLNKQNINYIVLKGLTLWHFNKKRRFGDLDILVGTKDFYRTIKLICNKLKYKVKKDHLNQLITGHHLELIHPHRICIEIHQYLTDLTHIDSKSLSLASNKIYLNIKNIKVPSLIPEFQLLEVILHNVYSHYFCANYNRWSDDINTIINNYNIDWNKFFDIISDLRFLELTYVVIKILDKYSTKINMPLSVLRKIYKNSSKSKLFFLERFENYSPEYVSEEISKRSSSYFRTKIYFISHFGFNKCFFRIFYYPYLRYRYRRNTIHYLGYKYIHIANIFYNFFKEYFFPSKKDISKKFKIHTNSPIIYFYYLINIINFFGSILLIISKDILFMKKTFNHISDKEWKLQSKRIIKKYNKDL
jgi:hypothetical protein